MCCTCRHQGRHVQPVDPGAVSAVTEEGEGEEGGAHRLHAEISNDLERDDARQSPVQTDGHKLRTDWFFL